MIKFVICANYCGNQMGEFYFTQDGFYNNLDAIDSFDEDINKAKIFDEYDCALRFILNKEYEDVEIIPVIENPYSFYNWKKVTVDDWDKFIDKHYNSFNHWDYAYICPIENLDNIEGNTTQDVETMKKFGFKYFSQDTNDEYNFYHNEEEALTRQLSLWKNLVEALN